MKQRANLFIFIICIISPFFSKINAHHLFHLGYDFNSTIEIAEAQERIEILTKHVNQYAKTHAPLVEKMSASYKKSKQFLAQQNGEALKVGESEFAQVDYRLLLFDEKPTQKELFDQVLNMYVILLDLVEDEIPWALDIMRIYEKILRTIRGISLPISYNPYLMLGFNIGFQTEVQFIDVIERFHFLLNVVFPKIQTDKLLKLLWQKYEESFIAIAYGFTHNKRSDKQKVLIAHELLGASKDDPFDILQTNYKALAQFYDSLTVAKNSTFKKSQLEILQLLNGCYQMIKKEFHIVEKQNPSPEPETDDECMSDLELEMNA